MPGSGMCLRGECSAFKGEVKSAGICDTGYSVRKLHLCACIGREGYIQRQCTFLQCPSAFDPAADGFKGSLCMADSAARTGMDDETLVSRSITAGIDPDHITVNPFHDSSECIVIINGFLFHRLSQGIHPLAHLTAFTYAFPSSLLMSRSQ